MSWNTKEIRRINFSGFVVVIPGGVPRAGDVDVLDHGHQRRKRQAQNIEAVVHHTLHFDMMLINLAGFLHAGGIGQAQPTGQSGADLGRDDRRLIGQ